jgi:predicted AlkP superfamily pyrophosphatase or phosphodiesterase
VVLISEYGIGPVDQPIHINRILRKEGLLDIRVERGLELLDAAASEAFAVSDHQIAHIYTKSEATKQKVKALLANVAGIDKVLDKEEKAAYGIDHERSGDLVLLAKKNAWFTYYFWEDDAKAPDYARMVDIHKKPGYDPVEMFMTSKSRAIYKLILKKIGIRAVLDITPLDPTLVKGSHGITDVDQDYYPILIGNFDQLENIVEPTAIKNLLLNKIFVNKSVDEIINS